MELIKERGVYNASASDWELAFKSQRGKALLEDAGEQLIGNTYLVMNDIRYVDHSTTWNTIKDISIPVGILFFQQIFFFVVNIYSFICFLISPIELVTTITPAYSDATIRNTF